MMEYRSQKTAGRNLNRWRPALVVLVFVATGVIAACAEDYQGGAACPTLCPEQNVVVFDTTFDPVELDTTVTGFPTHGTETELLLARRGDTVDTRPVIRFDSLPIYFNSGSTAGDTIIKAVDSPYVKLRINRPASLFKAPVTFDVFDVDTTTGDSATAANDTTTALEKLLYRPDRLIGSITLDTAQITDSVRIPLDSLTVLNKIQGQGRLRLGFRATSTGPVQIRIISYEGGDPAQIRSLVKGDSATDTLTVFPRSVVPRSQPTLAADLTDYVHVLSFPPVPDATFLTVGGVPGRRVLIRFNIPTRILDSSNVLRATLELTQRPVSSVDDTTKLTLFPLVVTAGTNITDVGRSAFLTNAPGAGFDSVQFAPGDSGVREIEVVNALRAWSLAVSKTSQRGIVLRAGPESVDPRFVSFFSSSAAANLRPRLRVSYSPVRSFGIP
jgi:hypothetical protein